MIDALTGVANRRHFELRAAVEAAQIAAGRAHIPVTACLGVAFSPDADDDIGPVMARADEDLYGAKRTGGNQALPSKP
jgi:GGDEF domain-containing protein